MSWGSQSAADHIGGFSRPFYTSEHGGGGRDLEGVGLEPELLALFVRIAEKCERKLGGGLRCNNLSVFLASVYLKTDLRHRATQRTPERSNVRGWRE